MIQKNKNHFGVIMAGGVGTRFWPLSRKSHPKQFLDVTNKGLTLFQEAYNRLSLVCPMDNIFVVTNELYRDEVKKEVPSLSNDQILGEPIAKNTAPCIAYASYKILKNNPNAIISVIPSDHLILEEDIFSEVLLSAFAHIEKDSSKLITLGIKPSRPDTGYGYIQMSDANSSEGIFKVKTFTEKPNLALAEQFVSSGEFLWNSGMFIWSAKQIVEEFKTHIPDIHEAFTIMDDYFFASNEKEQIKTVYQDCPSISIDYGVLEKSNSVFVIPAHFSWSDIGTWNALYSYSDKDTFDNVVTGNNVFLRETNGSIIKVSNDKLVVLNGVNNLIVVESDGILLIADRDKEQDIKLVVTEINKKFGDLYA